MTPIIEAFVYAAAAVAAAAIVAAVVAEFLTLRRKVAALERWREDTAFRLDAIEHAAGLRHARRADAHAMPAAIRERALLDTSLHRPRYRWPIIGSE